MPQRTLVDFFGRIATTANDPRVQFLVYDDGYRTWSWSYADVVAAARVFAARLRASGISKGNAIVLWGENRPEWIAALWGCILEGVVAVPIDYRASPDFMNRVAAIVDARVIVAGDIVDTSGTDRRVWALHTLSSEAEASPGTAGAQVD